MKKCTYSIGVNLTIVWCLVFSPAVYSANCGDPSPSVKRGLSPRAAIEPKELTEDEIEKVLAILKLIKGDWKGDGHITECITKNGKYIKRKEESSVEVSITSEDRESIDIKMELYLPSNKIKKIFTDRLYIDDKYLMQKDGPFNFKVTVLYVKDNFITYLRKTRLPGKGRLPVANVRTIAVYAKDSVMIEDINYINGMLSSATLYELR